VKQYQPLWEENGFSVIYFQKNKLSVSSLHEIARADVIINQKCLLSHRWLARIRDLGLPILFDLDDLVWHRANRDYSLIKRQQLLRRLRSWAKASDAITVANSFLQQAVTHETNIVPLIVPMSLDLDFWRPTQLNLSKSNSFIRLGWTGSPEYHWLLRLIEPELQYTLSKNSSVKLLIHSGKDPHLSLDYEFVQWEAGNESKFVQSLDFGLLPMESNSVFASGKSPIKSLQYLSSGVIPVGNFFGVALDSLDQKNSIFTDNAFANLHDKLEFALSEAMITAVMREKGLRLITEKHDMKKVGLTIIKIISNLIK
jgi:hypothetical protein